MPAKNRTDRKNQSPRGFLSDQDMVFSIGDEELEQGLRLICIGSPLSDVVLDA